MKRRFFALFFAMFFACSAVLQATEAARTAPDDWWIPHEDPQKARVDALEKDVSELRRIILIGNGHRPMTERVASLEQALETQTWLLRVILGGVLASLVGQFAPLIMRGRKAKES